MLGWTKCAIDVVYFRTVSRTWLRVKKLNFSIIMVQYVNDRNYSVFCEIAFIKNILGLNGAVLRCGE